MASIRSVFGDADDIAKGLKAFTLKLTGPAVEHVGWEFKDGEGYLIGQLRGLLISVAGLAGHGGTVQEALRRFSDYTSGKDHSAIHPSLRSSVFRIAVNEGGQSAYEAVKKEYLTTSSIDGKEIGLRSMGRVQTPELATDFLDFIFSPAVATQDMHSGAVALAGNIQTRNLLWDFIKKNWDTKVIPQIADRYVVLERFLQLSLKVFASFETQKDIEAFFADKDCRGFDRGLKVASDTILTNAHYKERDAAGLREWLSAHGYIH